MISYNVDSKKCAEVEGSFYYLFGSVEGGVYSGPSPLIERYRPADEP